MIITNLIYCDCSCEAQIGRNSIGGVRSIIIKSLTTHKKKNLPIVPQFLDKEPDVKIQNMLKF